MKKNQKKRLDQKKKTCVYCQKEPATTVDHVTLSGLFGSPRPNNLITVPACNACNSEFKNDDDYFLTLAMKYQASLTKDGSAVEQKRLRAMKKPEAKGQWSAFFKTVRHVTISTPEGELPTLEFKMETARLFKTVQRMIRGLFYHVTKNPMPLDYDVSVLLFDDFCERHKHNPEIMEVKGIVPLLSGEVIGDGTFEYRYMTPPNFWMIQVYGCIAFVGSVFSPAELKAIKEWQLSQSAITFPK